MKKRQDITVQTQKNLREAFWTLYTQKPIEKITVKEVTDAAGYNRGTFYLYYKDIYDILHTIEQEILDTIGRFANQWMDESIAFEWPIYVGQLLEWSQVYAAYISVLLSEHGDPAFAHRLKQILRPLIQHWMITTDHLPETELEILTEFHLAGTLSALSTWLSQKKPMSFEQFVGFMMKHFFPQFPDNAK